MWKLRWGSPSGPSSSPACPCDLVSLARVPFRLERGPAPHLPGPLTPALSPDGERGILRIVECLWLLVWGAVLPWLSQSTTTLKPRFPVLESGVFAVLAPTR